MTITSSIKCTIVGCDQPRVHGSSWCAEHGERFKRAGQTTAGKRKTGRNRFGLPQCSVDGCGRTCATDNTGQVYDLCGKHLQAFLAGTLPPRSASAGNAHAAPATAPKRGRPRKQAPALAPDVCEVDGCDDPIFVMANGRRQKVCRTHYGEHRRRKQPLRPEPAPAPIVEAPAPCPDPLIAYVGPRFCSACHTAYPATDRYFDLSKDGPFGLLNWICRHCDGTFDPAHPHVREVVMA